MVPNLSMDNMLLRYRFSIRRPEGEMEEAKREVARVQVEEKGI